MNSILYYVMLYCAQYNLDPKLVMSIIEVESGFNANAIGTRGEVGLMQLMPQYMPVSKVLLKDPRVNIKYGVAHIAKVRQLCKHRDDNTWLVCYNMGAAKGNTVKYPKLFPYYKKVMFVYQNRS